MSKDQYSISFNCSTDHSKDTVEVHAQLNSWEKTVSNYQDPGPNNQADFNFLVPRLVLALEEGDMSEALCIFLANEAIGSVDQGDEWQIMQEMLWNVDPDTKNVITLSVDGTAQKELTWPYREKYVLATVASGMDIMSTKLKLMERAEAKFENIPPPPRRSQPKI